jgi:uncharacterized protein YggU (UPF0235/DUF167 family)
VAVAAPPVDGAANLELSRILADYFGLSRGQVRILTGQAGKHKTVRFLGMRLTQISPQLAEFRR